MLLDYCRWSHSLWISSYDTTTVSLYVRLWLTATQVIVTKATSTNNNNVSIATSLQSFLQTSIDSNTVSSKNRYVTILLDYCRGSHSLWISSYDITTVSLYVRQSLTATQVFSFFSCASVIIVTEATSAVIVLPYCFEPKSKDSKHQ